MTIRSVCRVYACIGATACVSLLASACLDTGAKVASVELRVSGATSPTVAARDGWQVTLEQAQVAFGPLWLCAGSTAGELCDVARGEWLDAVVVDALSNSPKNVGDIWGHQGEVRSWMYDYGLVSLLTHADPFQTEAAKELNGNSVRLRGCATKESQKVCFLMQLPVAQGGAAEQGVPVVRVSGSGEPIAVLGETRRVTAVFDAADWLSSVDFAAMAEGQTCETDCGVIDVEVDAQAARAVRSALEGTARPTLEWKR